MMEKLQIFVSSPGDVAQERALTQRIIESLQGRFMGYVKLIPIFWEHEPLMASSSFQDQIILPSQTDIVICILWSRLGTRLPPNITRPDGTLYASGTEFEFEDAMTAYQKNGSPALLVYHKTKKAVISLEDEQALMDKMHQKKSLDQFIDKWFINSDGSIKSAFHSYEEIEEFESKIEQHLQVLIERQIKLRGLTDQQTGFESAEQLICPYRGLEAFDIEHENLFFGRTREIHEIIEALLKQAADHRAFLLILGASGSGKSSLIRAGVIPMLMRPGVVNHVVEWRQAVVRPTDSEQGVCNGLVKGLIQQQALPELMEFYPDLDELTLNVQENPEVLNVVIQRILSKVADEFANTEQLSSQSATQVPQARLLLLIDQFEELFTTDHISPEDRQTFMAVINNLARSGVVWVITTLRSDFYGRCTDLDTLTKLKEGHGQYDLLPPKATQIGQMIRQPALFGGLTFEKDPVTGVNLDEVLQDSATRNPNALPLLSFTLEALYNDRTDGGKLTFDAYRALGGLEGALAKRAENTFDQLEEAIQATLPQIMARLVQIGEKQENIASRRRCVYDPEQWPEINKCLVEAFIAARLFVSETASSGQVVITVAHEALIQHWPRLRDWVEDNRAALRIQHRISTGAKEWLQGNGDKSFLFTGSRLAEVEDWFEKYTDRLDEEELLFIQTSIELRDQKIREEKERQERELQQAKETARRIQLRNKWLSGIGIFSSILAVVAIGLYFQSEVQRERALTARNQADDLVGFMIKDLSLKLEEVGRLDILTDANEKATTYLAQQDEDSLKLEARINRIELFSEIGYVQKTQGNSKEALKTYQDMLSHSKSLVSKYPDAYDAAINLIVSHFYVGSVYWNEDKVNLALNSFRKQQTTALAMLVKWPEDPEVLDQLGLAYSNVGATLEKLEKYDEAMAQIQKAIEIGSQLLQQNPDDEIKLASLADNYIWLGKLLKHENELQAAHDKLNQAKQIFGILIDKNPGDTDLKFNMALLYQGLGVVHLQDKKYKKSMSAINNELAIITDLLKIDETNIDWQIAWCAAQIYLADSLVKINEASQALNRYNQTKKRLDELLIKHVANSQLSSLHAKVITKVAELSKEVNHQQNLLIF